LKILTVLGTRPEIIRLSRVIPKLDALCDHVLVHTGQNYDPSLSDTFFTELGVRAPDEYLGVRGDTFGQQVAQIIEGTERTMLAHRPDRLLILGDTNSALSAFVAKRLGIPVYHMEAGNRCYDDRVPEEVNRRVIDHSSDVLMPYTERSRQNLLREGIAGERIYVTGNPIYEVTQHYGEQIEESEVLSRLGVTEKGYFLVTMHRAENVDVESRLENFLTAFERLHREYGRPVVVSTHPRTRHRLRQRHIAEDGHGVRFLDPFGFFDFVKLERNAYCVLSDSGTVQEECCLFGVPNVTIRDVTERPETIECGSNILSGADLDMVLQCVRVVLSHQGKWEPPWEYVVAKVSETATHIVTGYCRPVA